MFLRDTWCEANYLKYITLPRLINVCFGLEPDLLVGLSYDSYLPLIQDISFCQASLLRIYTDSC